MTLAYTGTVKRSLCSWRPFAKVINGPGGIVVDEEARHYALADLLDHVIEPRRHPVARRHAAKCSFAQAIFAFSVPRRAASSLVLLVTRTGCSRGWSWSSQQIAQSGL